ncbi:MAG TPA: phytochelatin synthase family protein [Haliangiales bacterium]|nr:phytochelatin synthase family protein [Haliangiales bacterium]
MILQDQALLAAAADLPVASLYRRSGFRSQSARFLCGPASLDNVLRSLGEPVDRSTLLAGTGLGGIFGMRFGGMTLEDLAHVVRVRTGRRVEILRDLSLDAFRAHVSGANDPARRYIVNFHRRPVFGWGGGHHSPLAGYLAADDLALILDVNRRIGPWLVSTPRLHAAVSTLDRTSHRSRGLLLVE